MFIASGGGCSPEAGRPGPEGRVLGAPGSCVSPHTGDASQKPRTAVYLRRGARALFPRGSPEVSGGSWPVMSRYASFFCPCRGGGALSRSGPVPGGLSLASAPQGTVGSPPATPVLSGSVGGGVISLQRTWGRGLPFPLYRPVLPLGTASFLSSASLLLAGRAGTCSWTPWCGQMPTRSSPARWECQPPRPLLALCSPTPMGG